MKVNVIRAEPIKPPITEYIITLSPTEVRDVIFHDKLLCTSKCALCILREKLKEVLDE